MSNEQQPAPLTWTMMRTPEFWLMMAGTICGLIALSKRLPPDSIWHDMASGGSALIAAVTAWLTAKARSAPSPIQEAILDSKEQLLDSQRGVIETLKDCVRKNHPFQGPPGETGPAGPPGPPGPVSQ